MSRGMPNISSWACAEPECRCENLNAQSNYWKPPKQANGSNDIELTALPLRVENHWRASNPWQQGFKLVKACLGNIRDCSQLPYSTL